MPNIEDYPWVLDDDGDLSAILDQAYDVIIDYQMITDTNGQEILNFNLPLDDPKAEQFSNEDVLQVGGSEFTIRTITDGWDDNGEQCFQIYAEARWYELAEYDPIEPFQLTNVSPDITMEKFLFTTDWTIGTIDITTTSDFSITELTNPLVGIRMLPTIYGGELYFDNINKKVHLLQRIGMDTDLLYAYGKNLKKNQRIVDTRYLVTRFRPIGKDGLTIADVNNGVDYLENYQWFDAIGKRRKVKCDSLSNDNITDPTALMEWGQGIVNDNSIPRITYYMDIVLDKNDGIPGMGDTVRVYDSLLKMNLPSRVAQRSYNVLQPELSTMQLSTALYTLSDQLNNSVATIDSKINYLNDAASENKQAIIDAQSTADGKNTVFYGENEPDASAAKDNDLWFQYVDGTLSRMYRFDGVQWQLISSIIPGDAVIGGTIDFANVTAINIDAGSISVGTMLFDRLKGGSIKIGDPTTNGDLQVWADTNGDGASDIVGRLDYTGAYLPYLKADNIVGNVVNKWMQGSIWLYVDSDNGSDANSGVDSMANAKKNLQALLDSLPKDLAGSTLTIAWQGNNYGDITISGFRNGYLILTGPNGWGTDGNCKQNGKINVKYCSCKVFLQSIILNVSGDMVPVDCIDCFYIWLNGLKIYGNQVTQGYWFGNCGFRLDECHAYGISDRGLYAYDNSRGILANCKGNPTVCILSDSGSFVTGWGTRWAGSLVRWSNSFIGKIGDGSSTADGQSWTTECWSIDYGESSPPSPPPSPTQTATFIPSTGDNWSTSGYWTNDEVKQGNWGYGDRYGLWYVDLSAVKGKTIDSATITVSGIGAGYNGNKTIYIRSHNYTDRSQRPGGTPAISGNYVTGTVANGGTYTIDITSLIQSNIASGSDRSLGIYISGTANYMSVTTRPSITITYH
jgi:phage minor structural protein